MNYDDFEKEFRNIYPKLVRTMSFICINQNQAIEIAKESMANAYANWKAYDNSQDALFSAKQYSVKQLKKIKNIESTEINHINLSLIEDLEKNVIHLSSPMILKAIYDLEINERIAITLSYIDQEHEDAISKIMGVNLREVQLLLKSASNTLEFQLRTS